MVSQFFIFFAISIEGLEIKGLEKRQILKHSSYNFPQTDKPKFCQTEIKMFQYQKRRLKVYLRMIWCFWLFFEAQGKEIVLSLIQMPTLIIGCKIIMLTDRDFPLQTFKLHQPHVQVYFLQNGDYNLIGHGNLTISTDQNESDEASFIEVHNSLLSQPVLKSRLRKCNSYQQQSGSVIVFCDKQQKQYDNWGVSFESSQQCDEVWQRRRLICSIIDKNYLEISGREVMEIPSQSNLVTILKIAQNQRNLIEYHLTHNPAFEQALSAVFHKFQQSGNKNGMYKVRKIIKTLFRNLDYKMIQILFKEPVFTLLLKVQKFYQKKQFIESWQQKAKFRTILPLDSEIKNKIQIFHSVSFYKEEVLDIAKEGSIYQMLAMIQNEFIKDIIAHLTKNNVLEQVLQTQYQKYTEQTQNTEAAQKQNVDEQTQESESEQTKRLRFEEKKVQFLLEAMILSKKVQDQRTRTCFLNKIYSSNIIQGLTELLDKGIHKTLDFFALMAKYSPPKFTDYLQNNYKTDSLDNLMVKLCKTYIMSSQNSQILQILSYLSVSFREKESFQFFIESFFSLALRCSKDQKMILILISETLSWTQYAEQVYRQMLKRNTFYTLTQFLISKKQEKSTDLRAIKLLKNVLIANEDSSWKQQQTFLKQLNSQIVQKGFFAFCLHSFKKNQKLNNVLSSAMLQNFKILSRISRFTEFHSQLHKNLSLVDCSCPYMQQIFKVEKPIVEYTDTQQHLLFSSQIQHYELDPDLFQRLLVLNEVSQMEEYKSDQQYKIGSQPSKKVKCEIWQQVHNQLPFWP